MVNDSMIFYGHFMCLTIRTSLLAPKILPMKLEEIRGKNHGGGSGWDGKRWKLPDNPPVIRSIPPFIIFIDDCPIKDSIFIICYNHFLVVFLIVTIDPWGYVDSHGKDVERWWTSVHGFKQRIYNEVVEKKICGHSYPDKRK